MFILGSEVLVKLLGNVLRVFCLILLASWNMHVMVELRQLYCTKRWEPHPEDGRTSVKDHGAAIPDLDCFPKDQSIR